MATISKIVFRIFVASFVLSIIWAVLVGNGFVVGLAMYGTPDFPASDVKFQVLWLALRPLIIVVPLWWAATLLMRRLRRRAKI
jgi:uncharacterized membrane protein YhaH (DUF805 family)